MQYEMPVLTEEQKEQLIEFIRGEQEVWSLEGHYSTVLRIALAALSAEPVGEIIQFTDRVTGEKSKWRFSNNICGDTRGDVYQTTTKLVYTAPPVASEAACSSASSS